jgi:hypothetical protein
MGYFKEIEIDVIDAFDNGYEVDEIAAEMDMSIEDVQSIINKVIDGDFDCDPGDMDGDAESALASAGFGMDEDYGYAEDVL